MNRRTNGWMDERTNERMNDEGAFNIDIDLTGIRFCHNYVIHTDFCPTFLSKIELNLHFHLWLNLNLTRVSDGCR